MAPDIDTAAAAAAAASAAASVEQAELTADLLIMDDESKGTPQTEKIVAELQNEGYPVKIHVRRKGEGRGLSSAVLLGFEKAKYSTVMCMDADLQHEPESVPAVADPVSKCFHQRR